MALPNVYPDDTTGFIGIGRSNKLTNGEVLGLRAYTEFGGYGGMWIDTSAPSGRPFYGFSVGGTPIVRMLYDGGTEEWSVLNAGARLSLLPAGGVEIGAAE